MQSFHDVVVAIVAFVILIGVMVVVHELGHFIVAKLCGVRVEAFSVGFGPRLFGLKYGETDYKVCALPLGGYVKMTGETPDQLQEGDGAETAAQRTADDPGSFLNHPRWQRMLIGVAGPVANFILAFLLMLFYYQFINEVPKSVVKSTTVEWVVPGSDAAKAGLKPGDVIKSFDGVANPDWMQVGNRALMNLNQNVRVTVERDGAATTVTVECTADPRIETVTVVRPVTRTQVEALTAKVNTFSEEAKPSPSKVQVEKAPAPAATKIRQHRVIRHGSIQDSRFKKLESQLNAQGKEIDQTRSDLATTRTELGGSIAKTHNELVVLEKRGQRSYFEFDLPKNKQFKREGPLGVSLRKANVKHQYADLMLMVDDRSLQQKHVNLYQPAMFYEPDSPQPIEIVINEISKNHIHGYVSAPRYRKSELAAMANGGGTNGTSAQEQAANSSQGDGDIVHPDQAASTPQEPTLKQRPTQQSQPRKQ